MIKIVSQAEPLSNSSISMSSNGNEISLIEKESRVQAINNAVEQTSSSLIVASASSIESNAMVRETIANSETKSDRAGRRVEREKKRNVETNRSKFLSTTHYSYNK